MFFYSTNSIKIAVDRLGGPTKAANAVGVSNATIHNWIRAGRIVNVDKARLIAELAGMNVQDLRPTR